MFHHKAETKLDWVWCRQVRARDTDNTWDVRK